MQLFSTKSRKWLALPPIILGVILLNFFRSTKKEPERLSIGEVSRVLRVIQVPEVNLVPRILGYGTAEPEKVWRAVAEVKGRVIFVHPELKPGTILKKDEIILSIDTLEYDLAVAQLENEIDEINAQLSELEGQEGNFRASLEIEKASLVLAEKAFERSQHAAETRAVAEVKVESAEREVLAQRMRIQSIQNSLNLLPAKSKAKKANLAVKQAKLELTKIDLAKTVLRAPFACRLSDVHIERRQFLATGETLFEAHGIGVVEIEAHLPVDKMRNLLDLQDRPKLIASLNMESIRKLFNVTARVRLRSGDFTAEWEARFVRIREVFDQQTRTLGVVVAVDRPYEKVIPGKRPPLVHGMFCEVEIIGEVRKNRKVIPRCAIHNGIVYIVDPDSRLRNRPIETTISQANFVSILKGLSVGETIVVSDPSPAIDGILVKAMPDQDILESLIAEATGKGELK